MLTQAIFTNQDAYLTSLDFSNNPATSIANQLAQDQPITKTDVVANDKDFLKSLAEVLKVTQSLKLDEGL